MAITRKQYGWATVIVLLLLIIFLYYYLKMRNKKEKCPDGRDIPSSGNCADNPIQKDAAGNVIPQPQPIPDTNGCIQPSSYVTNYFPLSLGMKGDLIKQLQKGLNNSFNEHLSVDGYFGCNTLMALKKDLSVGAMDAQLFKDKILTPSSLTLPNTIT